MKISEQIQILPRKRIIDHRGLFLKPMTGLETNLKLTMGEVYVTTASPGNYRGNHYHLQANEWFTLISGEAVLILEDIVSRETLQIIVKAEDAQTYFIPAGLAHVFYNQPSNKSDFMLIAYADKTYDPADTITHNLLP